MRCRILPVIIILMIVSGCSTIPQSESWKGFAEWNYKSSINEINDDSYKLPFSIKVNNLESQKPNFDVGMPGGLLRLLPIFCLFSPPQIITNQVYGCDSNDRKELKKGETERVLVEELKKSRLFASVDNSDSGKDFAINGSINFIEKLYFHCDGLGALLAPVLFLPYVKRNPTVKAHFDIVSTDGAKVLLSKDYFVETSFQFGFFFYNTTRHCFVYGEDLLPQIIAQFIYDIKALPRNSWGAPLTIRDDKEVNKLPKNTVGDLKEQLKELDKLKKSGIITEEEYERLKSKTIEKY